MKIICSGYQKTGTKSLAAALRLLGYNVFDFEEQYYYLGKEIDHIFREGWTIEDIRRIYRNVDVVVDIPSCVIWEELHKAFPEAKVSKFIFLSITCSILLRVQLFFELMVYLYYLWNSFYML